MQLISSCLPALSHVLHIQSLRVEFSGWDRYLIEKEVIRLRREKLKQKVSGSSSSCEDRSSVWA